MANAKGEDKTVEAEGATLLDGTHQVVHRGVAVAVFLAQVGGMLLRQPEDVGRLADPAPVVEGGDLLFADALDVEGIARDEMAQALHGLGRAADPAAAARSEEHTSELQSLMRISYAVFCLKKKKN